MNMPFPVSQIPLDLTKDTPTKVDVAELRQELNAIGLTCRETTLSRLEKSKNEVLDRISDGEFEGFQFYHTADKAQIARHVQGGKPLLSLDQVVLLDGVPHAEWKPSSTVPFSELLYAVGQPGHFDLLKEQYLTFPGQESNQTYTGQRTTVEAIKDIFVEIANNIASAIVTGLNKPLMEAALANILRPVPEGATNYDSGLQNRSILLVTGYDGKYAQGIGVVNVEYRLQIKDYKEKKKGRHNESTLNVAVRAVTYTELKELEAEVAFLKAHLKNRMFVPEADGKRHSPRTGAFRAGSGERRVRGQHGLQEFRQLFQNHHQRVYLLPGLQAGRRDQDVGRRRLRQVRSDGQHGSFLHRAVEYVAVGNDHLHHSRRGKGLFIPGVSPLRRPYIQCENDAVSL